MSKHNQSAALGNLANFTTRPQIPETMDTEARLDRIETRLENIEKLLNTVLYGINDINESIDKVSKQPKTQTKSSTPKHPKVKKQAPTPNQKPKQSSPKEADILSVLSNGKPIEYGDFGVKVLNDFAKPRVRRLLQELIESKRVFMYPQECDGKNVHLVSLTLPPHADRELCKSQILETLSNGEMFDSETIHKHLPNSDFSKTFVKKAIDELSKENRVIKTVNENDGGKYTRFVSIPK